MADPRQVPADEPPGDVGEMTSDKRIERRRTYNRRREDNQVVPPYFEVFERIAVSLEHIEVLLRDREVTLPDSSGSVSAQRP